MTWSRKISIIINSLYHPFAHFTLELINLLILNMLNMDYAAQCTIRYDTFIATKTF